MYPVFRGVPAALTQFFNFDKVRPIFRGSG